MNRLLIAAAVVASPLAAVVAQTPMTGAAYVRAAGAGDQYEIQSSKLVLGSTQNAGIRSFAEMMVQQHTKSTADVKAAAASARITVPPALPDAKGMRDLAALRVVRGAARDRLYIQQQKASHQKALVLHQGYAASGTVPALKTVAGAIVPVVQGHIDMLAGM